MSQVPSTHQSNGELSFGVELEFLFYFKVPQLLSRPAREGEVTIDPAEEARLPPALTLPPERYKEGDSQDDIIDSARAWARPLIEAAIRRVPGARILQERAPEQQLPRHQAMYVAGEFEPYGGWEVKQDGSVEDLEMRVRGYGYLDFEVTSPVLWDRPESHQHVAAVVRELTRSFRVRVNLRTGLHCHVGAGQEPREGPALDEWDESAENPENLGRKHPLAVMRRAAALMWAADGFLCHAHPPERGMNQYSPPIRFCSRLAAGKRLCSVRGVSEFTHYVEQPLDVDVPFDEPPEKLPGQDLPSHTFGRLDGGNFFPAVRPETMDDAARKRFEVNADADPLSVADELVNKTVYSGVRHIMRCRSRTEIARLFAPPTRKPYYTRANYNVSVYQSHRLVLPATGTVEFREAAGSLSPQWVSVWSNICLGFFRFARGASDARFWAVIARLAEAEADALAAPAAQDGGPGRQRHRYDMVSLLCDMGLFGEALFLERQLRADPVRFWYPCRLGEKRFESDGASWYDPAQVGVSSKRPGRAIANVDRQKQMSIPSALSSPFVMSPVKARAELTEQQQMQSRRHVTFAD